MKTATLRCPCETDWAGDVLPRFIGLFIYFSYLVSPPMATVMTDGLRGLGIDGRGILSLFPDIFPIATLL